MKETDKKQMNDCSKYAAPSSTYTKSHWKTILKLPLASTLKKRPDENKIVDLDGNFVLKLRGGITRESLNTLTSKIEVDLIDPNTNKLLLRISRAPSTFSNEIFTATPPSCIGSEKEHTIVLLRGPCCRNYTLK